MMQRGMRIYRAFDPGTLALLLLVVSGCGLFGGEDATAAVAEAIEPASNATDSPEMAGLLGGLGMIGAPGPDAVEGFRCDESPDVTNVTVCDKQFPSSIHLEWTGCSTAPPPPPDGAPTQGHRGPPGGPGGPGMIDGTSTGSVDVNLQVALDPSTECGAGAVYQLQQSTTFEVQRSASNGFSASASGTSTSTATLGPDGETKTTQLDVTRSFSDGSDEGRSMHLTGETTSTFNASSGALVRTVNGNLQASLSDGNSFTIQIVDLVRPAPWVCRWPTSGSIIRTAADGTSHTLVYGPECGQATLDGEDITLNGPPGGGGCGGSGMPPPPDGTAT